MTDKERVSSPWARTMDRLHSPPSADHDTRRRTESSDDLLDEMAAAESGHYRTSSIMGLEQPLSPETAVPAPRRKRNNSLIPPELMNDNSEGGMERAALATVFGVKEYTESKIFWERQASAYYEGTTGFRPDSSYYLGGDTHYQDNASTSGYIAVTGRTVVSNPVGTARDVPPVDQSIASLVDSAFDHVGAINPSFPKTAGDKRTSFLLPDIPKVSVFNDLIAEDEQGRTTFVIPPSTPDPPAPNKRHSVTSSIFTSATGNLARQNTYIPYSGEAPLVFVENTPDLFDLLKSDSDERIIIWGLDPQYLSASMATTTKAGKSEDMVSRASTVPTPRIKSASSSATVVHGFSSNTTAAGKALANNDAPKSKKHFSSRWSGLQEGLKLSKATLPRKITRPYSLSKLRPDEFDANDPNHSTQSLFRFGKKHGKKSLSTLSESQATIAVSDIPKVIEAATIEKLVEKLTSTLDYTFMTDFFLTYRLFISSTQLCKLLILRFRWGLESDDDERRVVRIRTFVVIRHWLLNYFLHDFTISQELRIILTSFLNSLPFHPLVKQSPRDQRIVKSLKRVVRRLKKVHYPTASSDRVQIIAPPAPSVQQERVEEMVRAKLSQGAIARTTSIVTGVDVGDRHHGNIAVQDARMAPVVVVGSVRNPKGSGILDMDVYRSSTNPVKRNISTASVARLPLSKNKKELEAVKLSYLQRMEQQKRQMMMERHQQQGSLDDSHQNDMDDALTAQTDNSLESVLTPGRGNSEVDELEYSMEENKEIYSSIHEDQFYNEHLAAKLENERRLREEEEEQSRAAYFSASGPSGVHPLKAESAISSIHDQPEPLPGARANIPPLTFTPPAQTDPYTMSPRSMHSEDFQMMQLHPTEPTIAEAAAATARGRNGTYHKTSQPTFDSKDHPQFSTDHRSTERSGTMVSRIAQQLRDENDMPSSAHCNCIKCSGNKDGPTYCQRLSTLVTANEDRRRSLDHHRQRQADYGQNIHVGFNEQAPVHAAVHDAESHVSSSDAVLRIQEVEGDGSSVQYASQAHLDSGTGSRQVSLPGSPMTRDRYHGEHMSHPSHRMTELDIPKSINGSYTQSMTREPQHSFDYGRPPILSYRTEAMAQQFCLIEARVLANIDWEELVHCRWTKMRADSTSPVPFEEGRVSEIGADEDDCNYYSRRHRKQQLARHESGGVEQVIKRFNSACQWVSSEIVSTRRTEDRAKVIAKFIRLAEKCKRYCNFATLVQILLGLQSPAVSRLRKTWSRVGSAEMRTLDQLSDFTSPMKNWKHIRDSMTEIADKYGMSPTEVQIEMPGTNKNAANRAKIKIPFGGCIPFLGIYLSDLVFNSEQPPYLQPTHENHRIYQSHIQEENISPLLKQPLVNFRKHRITATVIKRVLIFQGLASRYSFEPEERLYEYCFFLESLSAEEIKRLSYEIEPDSSV